jgi:hypothetical protein
VLREASSILNASFKYDGKVRRRNGKEVVEYNVFAPVAVAATNRQFQQHFPQHMDRSIIIELHKVSRKERKALGLRNASIKPTPQEIVTFQNVKQFAARFLQQAKLDPDPPDIPGDSRFADLWRPLIAVADACGPEWGKRARAAMLALPRADQEEPDPSVLLLRHIKIVLGAKGHDEILESDHRAIREIRKIRNVRDHVWFDAEGVDGIGSNVLIAVVKALPESDGAWENLSPKGFANLLKGFVRPDGSPIKPHKFRGPSGQQIRGYRRWDFQPAFESYSPDDDEAASSSGERRLRLIKGSGSDSDNSPAA